MSSTCFRCDDAAAQAVVAAALRNGACAAAFVDCSAGVDDATHAAFGQWLNKGCAGTMAYMLRNREARKFPGMVLEGARTMLCCAFSYAPADASDRAALVADYARGLDYHAVLRRRLQPVAELMEECVAGSQTRICIDSAPLAERYWATRASIGACGLNGQFIVPLVGSKVFLAEILWTAAVDTPARPAENPCTGCGRCVAACPGHALDGRGNVDGSRCMAYFTTEHRGELPEGVSFGKRICGCDVCLDVCPLNDRSGRNAAMPKGGDQSDRSDISGMAGRGESLEEFRALPGTLALDEELALTIGTGEFRRRFAATAISRLGAVQLRRNASRLKK